jgi:hypothetical protein
MGRTHSSKQGKRKNSIQAITIVEGQCEELYINCLQKLFPNNQKFSTRHVGTRTDALSIVKKAIAQYKSPNIAEGTLYYAVFDRELENEPLEKFREIDQLLQLYEGKIIPIISNPHFEYVLFLHFKYSDAQGDYKEKLKALHPDFDKSEKPFQSFCDNKIQPENIETLKKHLQQRDNATGFNLSTKMIDRASQDYMPNSNFYVLIDALTENKP